MERRERRGEGTLLRFPGENGRQERETVSSRIPFLLRIMNTSRRDLSPHVLGACTTLCNSALSSHV